MPGWRVHYLHVRKSERKRSSKDVKRAFRTRWIHPMYRAGECIVPEGGNIQ